MDKYPKIGIIGYGFVGQAVSYGFSTCPQVIVDPKYFDKTIADLKECEAIFICVPTPMAENGSCDTSILRTVLTELRDVSHEVPPLVILKSTVPPRALIDLEYGEWAGEVYNPEFLTEGKSKFDFVYPDLFVAGGNHDDMRDLQALYKFSLCSGAKAMFFGTVVEASIVKYMINTYLAMKVEFFNEWKDVADSYDCHWPMIANAVGLDPRIGQSHTKVPGPDGKRGFGGACFPKDVNAILHESVIPLLAVTKAYNDERRRKYEPDARETEQNVKFE